MDLRQVRSRVELSFLALAALSITFVHTFPTDFTTTTGSPLHPRQTISSADSSIDTSSDAWASLVANVAPLLILVGEKHVKAYFKAMNKSSDHMLYAVGPIGLITAVVTLIRIEGTRRLKRLIGRQHEKFSEVLIDVTSVSTGSVSVTYNEGQLEETVDFQPDTIAKFYVHGKKQGSVAQLSEYVQQAWSVCSWDHIEQARDESPFRLMFEKSISICFRAGGCQGVAKTRSALFTVFPELTVDSAVVQPTTSCDGCSSNGTDGVEGIGSAYTAWTGVSLSITTNRLRNTLLQSLLRLILVVVCIGGYGAIIYANWRSQNDIQNTTLIAVGIFTSTIGAYYTAMKVDSLSEEYHTDIQAMNPSQAGFFNQKSTKEAGSLAEIPTSISLSFLSRESERELGKRYVSTRSTVKLYIIVGVMAVGYFALYLGLRTAQWWAALSILGVSAIASLGRVWATSDDIELLPLDLNHQATGFPFVLSHSGVAELVPLMSPFFMEDEALQGAVFSGDGNEKLKDSSLNSKLLSPCSTRSLDSTPDQPKDIYEVVYSDEKFQSPVWIPGIHYESICCRAFCGPLADAPFDAMLQDRQATFFSLALSLAIQIRMMGYKPIEFEAPTTSATQTVRIGMQDRLLTEEVKGCFLYSDLLSEKGVLRQPMDVLAFPAEGFEQKGVFNILVLYQSWFWRANRLHLSATQATTSPGSGPLASGRLLNTWNFPDVKCNLDAIGMQEPPTNANGDIINQSPFLLDGSGPLSPLNCIWMAAKIAFVVFHFMSTQSLDTFVRGEWERVRYKVMDRQAQERLVFDLSHKMKALVLTGRPARPSAGASAF